MKLGNLAGITQLPASCKDSKQSLRSLSVAQGESHGFAGRANFVCESDVDVVPVIAGSPWY